MSNKYPGGFVSLGGQIPSYSVVFDGTGDYLSVADNTALDMEASDFTMECWFKPNTSTSVAGQTIFGKRANASTYGGVLLGFWGTDLKPAMYATVNGSSWGVSNVTSSVALTVGVWSHLAFTRSGSTWTIWVNGFATATATLAGTVPNNTSAFTIGATAADGSDTICASNISNVRIVKGTALYTTSFTPPTGPLQNITNTSLLTCQSATLIDNSSNGFTVTASGNAAVSSLQPPFTSYNPNNLTPALGAATPGIWTLSQALEAKVTRSWPMYDPYYREVVLNLHGNGTNAAQNNTFLDSGPNTYTVTRNGNTTQGSFSPYLPAYSSYYDGGRTNWSETLWTGLSGLTMTIEFWIKPTAAGGVYNGMIFGNNTSGNTNSCFVYISSGYKIGITTAGSGSFTAIESNTPIPQDVWTHIAITISGSSGSATGKIYINGSLDKTQTGMATVINSVSSAAITGSRYGTSTYTMYGYVSNFRVVTGQVLYTGDFNPPLQALTTTTVGTTGPNVATSISGAVPILIYSNNRYTNLGNGTGSFTSNESCSILGVSPFYLNTAYDSATTGGSAYFDGTGDYLSIASATALQLSSSNFTVEFFIYLPAAFSANYSVVMGKGYNNANTEEWYFEGMADGTINWFYSTNGTSYTNVAVTTAIPAKQWCHVALSRSGNTLSCYTNGVRTYNNTSFSSTLYSGSGPVQVGGYNDGSLTLYSNCYLASTRIVKGSAVYDPTQSTLTIPTAPLTAVSNTSLLLSYTNGAIYDNAMLSNFETVGNAQISTSTKKYGTGSLAFDGTGDYLAAQGPALPYVTWTGSSYTIEYWIYANAFTQGGNSESVVIGNMGPTTSGTYWSFGPISSGVVKFYYYNGSIQSFSTSAALSTGRWYHLAFVNNNGALTIYIDGASAATATISGTPQTGSDLPLTIGSSNNASFNGYLDDVRITKGVARYTGNFQPPTSQLQDQ